MHKECNARHIIYRFLLLLTLIFLFEEELPPAFFVEASFCAAFSVFFCTLVLLVHHL